MITIWIASYLIQRKISSLNRSSQTVGNTSPPRTEESSLSELSPPNTVKSLHLENPRSQC